MLCKPWWTFFWPRFIVGRTVVIANELPNEWRVTFVLLNNNRPGQFKHWVICRDWTADFHDVPTLYSLGPITDTIKVYFKSSWSYNDRNIDVPPTKIILYKIAWSLCETNYRAVSINFIHYTMDTAVGMKSTPIRNGLWPLCIGDRWSRTLNLLQVS